MASANELFVQEKRFKPLYPSLHPADDHKYYTSEQKDKDRERGCTEDQISAVDNILTWEPNKWYDILGVEDICTTMEAHQAYKAKSLAVHPDKNKCTHATKAFQMVLDAANALKAGDDYQEIDTGKNSKDAGRKNPPKNHPKPTEYQTQIYKEATPYMEKLKENPGDKEAKNKLEELNKLISEQNRKDGKEDIQQCTIDYNTYISHLKMVIDFQEAIESQPTTKTEGNRQALAKEKLPQVGPALDKINVLKGYPRSWNIKGATFESTDRPDSTRASSPTNSEWQKPRAPDTTRDGHNILGARQCGLRGYRFVVENGKDWQTENCLEYRSGGELGFDIAEAYFQGKEKKDWDLSQCNVSREEDARNYRFIRGIASEPIKTKKIGSSPRYPESHICATFEDPTGEVYLPILSRSKLGKVIGSLAADREIATFYRVRKLTPPWEIAPIATREGKFRAIDASTARIATPVTAPAPAQAPEMTPLLTNKVEGMQAQMEMMTQLLQQLLAVNANVRVTA